MKNRKTAAILGTIMITAGLLAGCTKEKAEADVQPEESQEEAVQDTSEKTQTGNVTVVEAALEEGSKPLSYEDENGNQVGYEVDVLNAVDDLIEEYDFDVEFVSGEAASIGLDTGKYALIGGGLYKTAEREEKYLLPEHVNGVSLIYIYVREDDDSIHSLDDLVGKKISPVTPNGGIYTLLTSYNEEHPDVPLTFETSEDIAVAERFASLDAGECDAVVLPNNLGFEEIKEQLGLKLKAVQPPVKINGTLSELNEKWYGEDTLVYLDE